MGTRRSNTDTTHHLAWFFSEAAADVSGMRSSYWTLVEMAQSGAARQAHSGASRTPSPRALSAAGRESDIAARLEALTVEERVILSLAFGPSPWPVLGAQEQREDRRRLGEHPGVALVSPRAQRAFLAAVTKRERKAGEDERQVVVQRPAAASFTRMVQAALTEAAGKRQVSEIADKEVLTDGRIDAWRAGEDPRAAVKAMLDRGFVSWLRGPTLSDALLSEIKADCAILVRSAVKAWNAVAPKVERCSKCDGAGFCAAPSLPDDAEALLRRMFGSKVRNACPACNGRGYAMKHDQRRRAAHGPAGQESDDGDRQSGEYAIEPFAPTWSADQRTG